MKQNQKNKGEQKTNTSSKTSNLILIAIVGFLVNDKKYILSF